mmetsp:Transcript_9784/g.18930  ORF Transcript_9784/g.18930 Transcript_9784/m.18930 type:complete len:164 (-) Transcript_9784:1734-2225(-)
MPGGCTGHQSDAVKQSAEESQKFVLDQSEGRLLAKPSPCLGQRRPRPPRPFPPRLVPAALALAAVAAFGPQAFGAGALLDNDGKASAPATPPDGLWWRAQRLSGSELPAPISSANLGKSTDVVRWRLSSAGALLAGSPPLPDARMSSSSTTVSPPSLYAIARP